MSETSRLQSYLETFRVQFEPAFDAYLQDAASRLGYIDAIGGAITAIIRDFNVGGGKRVRAALVSIGYCACGNDATEHILRPAIAIELLHSFFLIHDDIIDRSNLRRNRPTVHRVFEEQYRSLVAGRPPSDRQHFANSMALLAGDLCCALAYEALSRSAFPSERLIAAIQQMHVMINATAVGQALDIVRPFEPVVREEAVAKIHLLKTAKYTFEGPIRLGLILGGAAAELIESMSRYAIPVGIAFQVQDDLLGVFGSEEELGKPVTSDIEEGKQTLLTVFVRDHGSRTERERLRVLLGKAGLNLAEFEEVRSIMRECGALSYCEERARSLVAEGKQAVAALAIPAEIRVLLEELADFVINRTA